MQLKNSSARYGAIAQLFHWAIVVLIVTQFILATLAEDAPLLHKAKLLTTHKSIGMTIFMLAVLRLLWRLLNPKTQPVASVRGWQERAATIMHWLLYALILITPLVGLLMSSARNYSVSYFGLFTWPNLVAPNKALFESLETLHGILAWTILNLAALHMLAALKHHFIDKDNVLRRMLPVKLR